MKIWCDRCGKETEHKHMHDSAHGIPGTHMVGSERYECKECGKSIFAGEGKPKGLVFDLD